MYLEDFDLNMETITYSPNTYILPLIKIVDQEKTPSILFNTSEDNHHTSAIIDIKLMQKQIDLNTGFNDLGNFIPYYYYTKSDMYEVKKIMFLVPHIYTQRVAKNKRYFICFTQETTHFKDSPTYHFYFHSFSKHTIGTPRSRVKKINTLPNFNNLTKSQKHSFCKLLFSGKQTFNLAWKILKIS